MFKQWMESELYGDIMVNGMASLIIVLKWHENVG